METPKKEMQIVGEQAHISNTPQTDAEGQTIIREFHAQAPTTMQGSGPGAAVSGNVGNLPTLIQYSAAAGEMANAARTACVACKHFDNKAWLRFISNAEGPASSAESRQTLQTMRERIKRAGYGFQNKDGSHDVEATLQAHGICRVLSDWVEAATGRDPIFWPVVPWREANCPNICRAGPHELNVTTPAEPFGLFSPIDTDAQKIGANRYDTILKGVDAQNRR